MDWTSCVVVDILNDDPDIPGEIYGPFDSSHAEIDATAFAHKYFPGRQFELIKVTSPIKVEIKNKLV